jgi:hypothetical protein
MLVVCVVQPAADAAAAEAEDDRIEKKQTNQNCKKNSEMLMIARLSN